MASLLQNAEVYFSDQNGRPLVGGKVYFYFPGTENKKDTFKDAALSIPNTNPVILDARGNAIIWGTGSYRQVLHDANDVLIWDQLTQENSGTVSGDTHVEGFVAGTDFTPGTTASLTLSRAYGSVSNIEVYFDGSYQQQDQLQSLVDNVLTFTGPIPVGVSRVEVRGGTTVPISVPAQGSVTDAMLAPGSNVSIIIKDTWTLKKFGAKGDNVKDDTAAILNAVNSGELDIQVTQGTYAISAPILLARNYFNLRGIGGYGAVFESHDAAAGGIAIQTGMTGINVSGIRVVKNKGQVVAGDGVAFLGTSENCTLDRVFVSGFYKGFVLGTTDRGEVIRCTATQNWAAGVDMSNDPTYGPTQWQLSKVISAQNNFHGFYLHSNAGAATGMVLGAWDGIQTYANNGFGLIVSGSSACPIFDLAMYQFFFGNDNQGSVYIDSHGYNNRMGNGIIEESARGMSGPNLTIAATGLGSGLHVGPSEVDFSISDATITESALCGIESFGGDLTVSNVNVVNAGTNPLAGTGGLVVHGGTAVVSGGRFRGSPYGFITDNTGAIIACGSNCIGNTNGPTNGITAASKITGCAPLSMNN